MSRSLAAALLLLSSFAAPAQQAARDEPVTTLKLSTRLVVLDVVVTDKQRHVVTTGLTRDDFSIVEEKVTQTIRSFDPPEAHAMPAGVVVNSAADLKKIGNAPVTLLVVDELNTRFEDMSFARNAMVKYLQAQPVVLAQPTVLLLTSNTRFQQLHDYTQNRDELIDQIKHHMPEYPTKFMAGGSATVERMVQTLGALEQIAQASSGTPGRKNVIWVGAGFPTANLPALDPKTADTIQAAVKVCIDQLLLARVIMYTINPSPNTTAVVDVETPDDLALASNDQNSLNPYQGDVHFSTLGPATGGRAFLSRNDLNNEIAEGITQGANYYTLSYAPADRTEPVNYHHISILMRDRNLHATTRNGYFPASATTQNITVNEPAKQARSQLILELSNAVNSAITYNGLDVSATRTGSAWAITVKGNGLDWRTLDSTRQQTEATVMAAWYDAKGKLLGHSGKELQATRPTAAPNDAAPATFLVPITLTGSAVRLRFIVRDAVNARIGTFDILKP